MTLPIIQSPLLARVEGVRHAFFTRKGGVSTGVYDSLNVGRGSRDEPADVAENRRRAAAWFDLPSEALNTCYQIHSAIAVRALEPCKAISAAKSLRALMQSWSRGSACSARS